MHSSAILPYQPAAAACHPFDPRAARVAQLLANLICARMPDLTVEHVGSTSVPGCAGKGIVDLMVLYPPGLLAEARDTLDALGFQPQTAGVIHGAERPMRVGAVELENTLFRVHAHVLGAHSRDAALLRMFRDRLRADPALVRRYVECKLRLFAAGITEPAAYTRFKSGFISEVLGTA